MPISQQPTFSPVQQSLLQISEPASGGLNLHDLEYQLETNQSPYMLNMMYREGAFSKRYGQEYLGNLYENTIYSITDFEGTLIIHSGSNIYVGNTVVYSSMAEQSGLFVHFSHKLYYFCSEIYVYDGTTFSLITPFVPNVFMNKKPDGTGGDFNQDYNLIGAGYMVSFHGDNTSVEYHMPENGLDETVPIVKVGETYYTHDETLPSATTFKVNYSTGVITFHTAPPTGENNVEITVYKTKSGSKEKITGNTNYSVFGGNNNSYLFLAGNGKSVVYYSAIGDATYFPDQSYIGIGNNEYDVIGFGLQYNALIAFKPKEIYSISYYTLNSSNSSDEDHYGNGAFSSQIVNNSIGCDCPKTIQLINNQLTWLSSIHGVCTLVSTKLADERNVRTISRNINNTRNGQLGLLDWTNIKNVCSIDYDNRYFLANPTNGECFMWDYGNSPYTNTGKIEDDAKRLAWYKFSNFYAKDFYFNTDCVYLCSTANRIVKLNYSFDDFGQSIESYYQTPLFTFNRSQGSRTYLATEYLKNVNNLYVQCRGDTASKIDIYYYTDESSAPVQEGEQIVIGGRIWNRFEWSTFAWEVVNWSTVFRRKCSLKKIQLASFLFRNNELSRDMSITSISIQYQIVKNIK